MKRTIIVGGLLILLVTFGCNTDTQGESEAGVNSGEVTESKFTLFSPSIII